MSYAAAWISDVTGVPGNYVQVKVKDGLTRCRAQVESDVEAIWRMAGARDCHRFVDCDCERGLLFRVEIVPSGGVPVRDEEKVAKTYGKAIPNGVTMRPREGDAFRANPAEWTVFVITQHHFSPDDTIAA
jgi:hypothetical protein